MKLENVNFTGISWDGKAIESINNISKALLNLTELFKSQNIHIDTLIRVEHPVDVFTKKKKSKLL